ncbi:cytochrome c oxidase subunit 3 family protein [Microvirga sp. 2TAF3]|uniref:cytochrome c oxidase subunit 3 family protein n=1 Tax=Microvirga sp. 2TAF3 TaxID=3233014 RepID=UPI003F963E7D
MSHSPAILKEPWRDLTRQRESATFGIWVFLASELLFFGALLMTYTVYRIENPQAFAAAARETNIWYGTINTAVLLTSSLTMAVAAQGAERGWRRLAVWCLAATAGLGLAFGILKGFEYAEDIRKSLVPGPNFALHDAAAQLFFALYWTMTGLHAIHLTIGIALVGRLCLLGALGRIVLRGNPQVEVTALYWHLIDVIWIILYPLLYFPGRAS